MTPIKKARMAAGMTQSEFAKKLGVSSMAVSAWENGKALPNVKRLREVAEALNIQVMDLLDSKESRYG